MEENRNNANNGNGQNGGDQKGPRGPQSMLIMMITAMVMLVVIAVFSRMLNRNSATEITYNEFWKMVDEGRVASVEIDRSSQKITVTPAGATGQMGMKYYTGYLDDDQLIHAIHFHRTILFLIEQSASLCHRGFWLLGWRSSRETLDANANI